ncbi:S-adenosyl-L-methionine-dependent methyltransferase [Aspergillus karnatakaensis]|uniref:S-adenosyl-L-methionine-dependent methyltransferase n=1 Tax=Aspergillus karnatakaensis TaxID=1810916 RepID=UPI003CCCC779
MDNIIHPNIQGGSFRQLTVPGESAALTVRVTAVLHHEKSRYHDLLVFAAPKFGVVIAIDGVIRNAERRGYFHEIFTHTAMNSHLNPKSVLVLGGVDSDIVQEVILHRTVEEVTVFEIDVAIVRLCRDYFPPRTHAYPRLRSRANVHLHHDPKYLEDKRGCYDVIITCNDASLGSNHSRGVRHAFFRQLDWRLRGNGILAVQVRGSLMCLREALGVCRGVFPVVEYAHTPDSNYRFEPLGFILCSKTPGHDVKKPLRSLTHRGERSNAPHVHYNSKEHSATFTFSPRSK